MVGCATAGQIVYHGPREEVLPFFASCGFRPPVRKATPDFLQEVTSQKDQQVGAAFTQFAAPDSYALNQSCFWEFTLL